MGGIQLFILLGSVSRPSLSILLAVLGLLVAAPAALALSEAPSPGTAPATPPTTYSPTRVIVQWETAADHGDKVAAREDADVEYATDLGQRDFQLVEVEPGQTPAAAVSELEADPAVAVAERDGYRSLDSIPNDPLFNQLWGLRNLGTGIQGFSGAVAGDDIDAAGAWIRTVGTPSTVVADIDSGYRFNDPDLGPVAWTNPGEIAGNGIDDDGNGYVDDVHGYDFVGASSETPTSDNDPTDDNLISGGHGLHTAGTIGAAGNNGVGITGVAQNVRIMPLRVCANDPSINEARCPFSSILAAINYAGDMHARAANMSLGGNTFTQTEVNAIAAHPQTLYVISAGNDGGNNDGGEAAPKGHHYPCDYQPTTQASPPVAGAIDNIVCVAATDQADGLASFSDWGSTSVDLGAPGTATLSTYSGQETPFNDNFETNDFATRWTPAGSGFGRAGVGDGPLTSFGMTDSPGATPVANSVHEVTMTTGVALPAGTGACRITGLRLRKGGSFEYGLVVDGVKSSTFVSGETAGSSMLPFNTIPILNLGGHSVKLFFKYTAGGSPVATDGIWLDNLALSCYAPLSAPLSYEFLQGTSMAAPHVTGAAALLFSQKPSATVTEVRNALLSSADPVTSLSGKTTTGGRLDVSKAMDIFDKVAPAAPLLTSTSPASPGKNANPRILGSAEDRSHVAIYRGANCTGSPTAAGTGEELASPGIAVNVPNESTDEFSARATDTALNTSPCSTAISYTNSITAEHIITTPPPTGDGKSGGGSAGGAGGKGCTVPKLVGLALSEAKTELGGAGCTLGKVAAPKKKKGRKLPPLVVKSSSPAAGASSANGTVDLTLGKKPKKHRH
jgi:subtilisin family serine protease